MTGLRWRRLVVGNPEARFGLTKANPPKRKEIRLKDCKEGPEKGGFALEKESPKRKEILVAFRRKVFNPNFKVFPFISWWKITESSI